MVEHEEIETHVSTAAVHVSLSKIRVPFHAHERYIIDIIYDVTIPANQRSKMWSFAIGTVFLLSVRAVNVDPSAVKSFFDSNVSGLRTSVSAASLSTAPPKPLSVHVVSITGCDKKKLCGKKCFDEWDHG